MRRSYLIPNGWSEVRWWYVRPSQCLVLRINRLSVGNVYRKTEQEQWEANVYATSRRERATRTFWRRSDAKRWVEMEVRR